jgi:hypothetical protein
VGLVFLDFYLEEELIVVKRAVKRLAEREGKTLFGLMETKYKILADLT